MPWPLIAAAALSIGGSVYSGYQKKEAAKKEASLLKDQGAIEYQEALRDAALVRKEGEVFAAEQSLQYIGAGFRLAGSALITIADTKIKANDEADAIVKRGEAKKSLADRKAKMTADAGRAAFISSIIGGGSKAFSVLSPTPGGGTTTGGVS